MGLHKLPVTEAHRNPPLIHIDRTRLEALIENAIALLDAIDGDPDIEDDEPDEEHDGGEDEYHQAPDYGVNQTVNSGW
jgi:hypothetical protein